MLYKINNVIRYIK